MKSCCGWPAWRYPALGAERPEWGVVQGTGGWRQDAQIVLGGVKTAAEMINLMGTAIEGTVIESIRNHDPDLAQKIMDKMFVFDDVIKLDDKSIQAVLKEVSSDVLIVAFGVHNQISRRSFFPTSSRAAESFMWVILAFIMSFLCEWDLFTVKGYTLNDFLTYSAKFTNTSFRPEPSLVLQFY